VTAPAAPVIHGHSIGSAIRLHFPAVSGAATYDIYAGGTAAPTSTILTGQTGIDITFLPLTEPTFIRVKAINAGAEASGYSNEVMVSTSEAGRRIITHDPFGAYDRRDT
jgi:hypothetical protein